MADEDVKKIKELEETLARELDQRVNLHEPTDTRMSGGIDLNPNLKTEGSEKDKTYEPVPKPDGRGPSDAIDFNTPVATAQEDEISLEDLDSLLEKEMPELKEELNTLRDAGNDPSVKNADLSQFDVAEGAATSVAASEPAQKLSLFKRLKMAVQVRIERATSRLNALPTQIHKYTIKFIKEDSKRYLSQIVTWIKETVSNAIKSIKGLTLTQKLSFIGFLLVVSTIVVLLMLPGGLLQISSDPYLSGFSDKSNTKENYRNEDLIPLSENGVYPENVVLIEKVVVNIRPSTNSTRNPMMAARFYFEMNTPEGAVEIKDREKEIRDIIQRVLETFDYDQVISATGKKNFKEQMRREISSVMNTGIVKDIFIDDILVKP